MRTCCLLFFVFLCAYAQSGLWGQSELSPRQQAPLFEHLRAINSHWAHQVAAEEYDQLAVFTDDNARIQRHLERVEAVLRRRPTDHLTAIQRRNRRARLDALRAYYRAGRFPRNTRHRERTPYFIDDRGVACAVGQLLIESGGEELAQRIHREDNYAWLPDLVAAYPELTDWAQAQGFVTAELAWIQPGYDFGSMALIPTPFRNNLGVEGGTVRKLVVFEDQLYFVGSFTHIDGEPFAYLASWDGDTLRGYPGIEGPAENIAFDPTTGDIYLQGEFGPADGSPGSTVWLMRYRNGEWEPLLNGYDIGVGNRVNDVIFYNGRCYVAGDFQSVYNQGISGLAVYDTADEDWHAFSPDIRISGRINDISRLNESILLGGNFELEHPGGNQLHLARLDLENKTFMHIGQPNPTHFTEVLIADISTGTIRAVFDSSEGIKVAGPGWNLYGSGNMDPEFRVNGFLEWDGSLLGPSYRHIMYYGNHLPSEWQGNDPDPGRSLDYFRDGISSGWAEHDFTAFNGEITAMTVFQGQLFLAGDFTSIEGEEVVHFARAGVVLPADDPLAPDHATVASDGRSLFLRDLPADGRNTELQLYDLHGRPVRHWTALPTGQPVVLQPGDLPSGAYFYRLAVDGRYATGKVVFF